MVVSFNVQHPPSSFFKEVDPSCFVPPAHTFAPLQVAPSANGGGSSASTTRPNTSDGASGGMPSGRGGREHKDSRSSASSSGFRGLLMGLFRRTRDDVAHVIDPVRVCVGMFA